MVGRIRCGEYIKVDLFDLLTDHTQEWLILQRAWMSIHGRITSNAVSLPRGRILVLPLGGKGVKGARLSGVGKYVCGCLSKARQSRGATLCVVWSVAEKDHERWEHAHTYNFGKAPESIS